MAKRATWMCKWCFRRNPITSYAHFQRGVIELLTGASK